jgi:flagellar export protein FliJ
MRRRNRMQSLERLAAHAEAEQARRLAERLRGLDTEERRLEQIRSYLADYAKAPTRGGPPLTISALQSQRGFMERLRNAVDQQRGTVDQQRQQAEQQATQWRGARARTLALKRLGERLDQQERQRQDRRDQARMDEVGARPGPAGSKL